MQRVFWLFITIFLSSFMLTFLCSAQTAPVNTTADGVAIKGYDTVAYFTLGRPVKGSQDLQYEWRNAKWFFTNQKHLELFKGDPGKYAPQYGGY